VLKKHSTMLLTASKVLWHVWVAVDGVWIYWTQIVTALFLVQTLQFTVTHTESSQSHQLLLGDRASVSMVTLLPSDCCTTTNVLLLYLPSQYFLLTVAGPCYIAMAPYREHRVQQPRLKELATNHLSYGTAMKMVTWQLAEDSELVFFIGCLLPSVSLQVPRP
jgi:hypothetical protein